MTAPRRHDLKLFDDFERTDTEPARRTEEGFDWWNRSAWRDVVALRDELEYWFGRYCPNDAARMRMEFRSKREAQHVGALFELFMHEQLLRAGFEVQCQVELPGSPNRPDFLALAHGRPAFYVEAKAKLGSEQAAAVERRRQEVMEVIRHLRSPDFLITVTISGRPTKSVNKSSLKRDLSKWLDLLSREREAGALPDPLHESRRTFEWCSDELTLEFRAMPRTDTRGVEFGSLLACEIDGEARVEVTDAQIAAAVEEKGARYDRLGLPYLVAIDLMDFTTDADDVELGLMQAWGTGAAPRNQEVSGVLLAHVPNMSAAVAHIPHLVLNPHAAHPLGEYANAFKAFTDHLRTPARVITT